MDGVTAPVTEDAAVAWLDADPSANTSRIRGRVS